MAMVVNCQLAAVRISLIFQILKYQSLIGTDLPKMTGFRYGVVTTTTFFFSKGNTRQPQVVFQCISFLSLYCTPFGAAGGEKKQ